MSYACGGPDDGNGHSSLLSSLSVRQMNRRSATESTVRESLIQVQRDYRAHMECWDGECECVMEDDDGESETTGPTPSLAEMLTNQTWHEVGNGLHPLNATCEFELMVDQLSSILIMRLRNLVVHRITGSDGLSRYDNVNSCCSSNGSEMGILDHNGNGTNTVTSSSCSVEAMKYLKVNRLLGNFVLQDSISNSMRDYVACIGRMYNPVGFHSFEHATHVTISMNKLLSMMALTNGHSLAHVQSWQSDLNLMSQRPARRGSEGGHGRTTTTTATATKSTNSFGISEDPLILFSMVFSALIHDVGHKGVPNSVLIEEEDELAILHNDVSVAEQNSLQVAFSILQQNKFAELKRCICPTTEERKFFRKTVISMVMITDISDQERVQIVSSRWNAAFPQSFTLLEEKNERGCIASATNLVGMLSSPSKKNRIQSSELKTSISRRRFTQFTTDAAVEEFRSKQSLGIRMSIDISGVRLDAYRTTDQLQRHAVLETIMNVADVAHTMQSFRVFVKWNKRLFKELYVAHLSNRLSFDPTVNWYHNQIGFFTHVILPLTQKMKKCGIFGATGSVFEYFATENKRRWISEGEQISKEIIQDVKNEVEKDEMVANVIRN